MKLKQDESWTTKTNLEDLLKRCILKSGQVRDSRNEDSRATEERS